GINTRFAQLPADEAQQVEQARGELQAATTTLHDEIAALRRELTETTNNCSNGSHGCPSSKPGPWVRLHIPAMSSFMMAMSGRRSRTRDNSPVTIIGFYSHARAKMASTAARHASVVCLVRMRDT